MGGAVCRTWDMPKSNVIDAAHRFRADPHQPTEEEVVRPSVALFQISDSGQVDLADGVAVTDAVAMFWEALQDTVHQDWAEQPLATERARVQVLVGFLDKVRPDWRDELMWKVEG